MRVPEVPPARPGWGVGLWLALAVLLGAGFPYFEATRNANERPRLIQALVWLDTGSWAVEGPAARGLDPGPDVARSPVDGRLYPNKPPGATLVAALGVSTARWVAESQGQRPTLRQITWWARWFGAWWPTLLLAELLRRRYRPTFGASVTTLAVLTWALATPAQSYAHLLYGHSLAALGLVGGIVGVARALEPGAAGIGRRSIIGFVGGLLAAAAVGVEYMAAFAGVPLGCAVLWALRSPQTRWPAVCCGLGAVVPLVALGAYHHVAFGSPWLTGYHFSVQPEFAAKHAQGFLGLTWPSLDGVWTQLLAPGGGLLWWAPVSLLGIYGLVHLAMSRDPHRLEARLHLGLVAVMLWVVVSLSFAGGWRVGPRYFVPALPALVLGWAHWWSHARTSPAGVFIAVVLTVYGVAVNTLAANLWPHFDLDHVRLPVIEVLWPLGSGDWRTYAAFGTVPGFDWLGWVVAGALVVVLMACLRATELGARRIGAVALGAVVGLLLMGLQRGWAPHPDGARNLRYIQGVWEPRAGEAGPTVPVVPMSGGARPGGDGREGRRGRTGPLPRVRPTL